MGGYKRTDALGGCHRTLAEHLVIHGRRAATGLAWLRSNRPRERFMGRLDGKIALVTGGTSGIGLATAKEFVNEGAYVFVTGRREAELTAAVRAIGRNAAGVRGDTSNLGDLDRLFARIKREPGRLDVVFANAGVAKYAAFGDITEELYDSTFDINVKGVLFTVQKA